MMSWQELLAPFKSDRELLLGPFTHQFVSATMALEDAPWFHRVGQVKDEQSVTSVASWSDALTVFDKTDERYHQGHLAAPMWLVIDTVDRYPERSGWVETAYSTARDRLDPHVSPTGVALPPGVFLGDHVIEYVHFLLMEIAVQDIVSCSYFREQLPWWAAGHFPCGWDGTWPVGRLRVL